MGFFAPTHLAGLLLSFTPTSGVLFIYLLFSLDYKFSFQSNSIDWKFSFSKCCFKCFLSSSLSLSPSLPLLSRSPICLARPKTTTWFEIELRITFRHCRSTLFPVSGLFLSLFLFPVMDLWILTNATHRHHRTHTIDLCFCVFFLVLFVIFGQLFLFSAWTPFVFFPFWLILFGLTRFLFVCVFELFHVVLLSELMPIIRCPIYSQCNCLPCVLASYCNIILLLECDSRSSSSNGRCYLFRQTFPFLRIVPVTPFHSFLPRLIFLGWILRQCEFLLPFHLHTSLPMHFIPPFCSCSQLPEFPRQIVWKMQFSCNSPAILLQLSCNSHNPASFNLFGAFFDSPLSLCLLFSPSWRVDLPMSSFVLLLFDLFNYKLTFAFFISLIKKFIWWLPLRFSSLSDYLSATFSRLTTFDRLKCLRNISYVMFLHFW